MYIDIDVDIDTDPDVSEKSAKLFKPPGTEKLNSTLMGVKHCRDRFQ